MIDFLVKILLNLFDNMCVAVFTILISIINICILYIIIKSKDHFIRLMLSFLIIIFICINLISTKQFLQIDSYSYRPSIIVNATLDDIQYLSYEDKIKYDYAKSKNIDIKLIKTYYPSYIDYYVLLKFIPIKFKYDDTYKVTIK